MNAALKPRFVNPDIAPAQWPFRPTIKRDEDIVLSNIGLDFSKCRRDRLCRGRCCKKGIGHGS